MCVSLIIDYLSISLSGSDKGLVGGSYRKLTLRVQLNSASAVRHSQTGNKHTRHYTTIRLFADDCVIYRKIINKEDMEKLQKDLDRLGEWAVENAMKINPSKIKAVRFTRARLKDPLDYLLANTLILEASSCKYLGIILRSNLSCADQVNYMVKRHGGHYIPQCEY